MEKLYLGQLLDERGINILKIAEEKNVFLISPTGSGKTYFIMNCLANEKQKILYLCDNNNLKEQILLKERCANSKGEKLNKEYKLTKHFFGRANIEVMCFAEFGSKIKYDFNNSIIQSYDIVIVDEVHNLINYQEMDDSAALHSVQMNIFKKYDKTKIFIFTGTPYYLDKLKSKFNNIYDNFERIDFSKDKEIKRYIELVRDSFGSYKQIPTIINRFKASIEYGNKVLIYTRAIETMKTIEESLSELEYIKPICIWSLKSDKQMNDEQKRVRQHIIQFGELPEPYNVLIINKSMETGINIYDECFKYCIINTTNVTEQIQARG